ncbi:MULTISPECIES: PilZ domain-containing protein [Vibrio]|uniref:PilZ domain-containing protein n=1 Tax=Vibrio TaxID=662 RepID=UPI003D0CC0F8
MSQNDFFTVNGAIRANIEPMEIGATLPELDSYLAQIPAPFVASCEFSQLNQQREAAKHELQQQNLKQVAELIDQQNTKLNLLLNYMIAQQDEPAFRQVTTRFGAGEIVYRSQTPLSIGQLAVIKLFLDAPPAGIYCYGEVTDVQLSDSEHSDSDYTITLTFVRILEEHQDMLIKAALYHQQKLLRQRSLDRDKS